MDDSPEFGKSISLLAKTAARILKKQGLLKPCHRMCHDCAFKYHQPQTPEYFSVANAAETIIMCGGKVNCHTIDHQDAGKLCAGFILIKEA